MKGRLSIAAVLCVTSIAAQTRPGEKRFSLRGQVVDGLSGRPIPDVELALDTTNWEAAAEPVTPDPKGQFVFRGLAAGEYVLRAFRPDLGTVFFDELPDPGTIQTIRVGPKDDEKVILFRLVPHSVVTGVVWDEFGDPVLGAAVTVSRPVWRDGQIVLGQFNQATTDDRGRYRISNLRPGSYTICATGNMMGDRPVPMSGPVDFTSHSEPRFYARSCDPGTSSTLRIARGQRTEIHLTLGSTSGVWVRGRVLNGLPKMGINVRLMGEDHFDPGRQHWPAYADPAQGTFAFRGVPQGRYRLEAEVTGKDTDGTEKSLTARLPIEVGSADLNGIELALEPAGEMDVVLHGPEDSKIDSGNVTIGLRSTTADPTGTRWAEAGKNGSLRLGSLPPGSYWFLTRTTKESICIESARLGEQNVLQRTVTVTPAMAARLDVTVSRRCGLVKGRVVLADKPVPDAKVLLLLSGSTKDPGDLVTDFADDQGEFSFAGLPPGRYQLWAWSVDESGSFVGPASLADEEDRATAVVVRQGETVTVDVVLLKPEEESK